MTARLEQGPEQPEGMLPSTVDRPAEERFGHAPTSSLPVDSAPLLRWIDARLPLVSAFRREYVDYPMPRNLNGLWNFGAFVTVSLLVLLLSGIFLAVNYTATIADAFNSVELIDRQVPSGWLVRSIHMGGVSMFFAALYIHVWRSLYYGSYKAPRELLWLTGMVLMAMCMGAAFAGYVLPWGQMSFWGLTVAMRALSSVPLVGTPLAHWLLGGALADVALHRIYVLHFVLAFSTLAVVGLHVTALHVTGSNNPLGVEVRKPADTLPFHPYYTAKDGVGLALFALVFAILIFFLPGWLTLPDNYLRADPLSTPADITPEWYFAPLYAILRAGGGFGVPLAAASIAVLFVLPWLDRSPVRSARFRPWFRVLLPVAVLCFVFLGVAGFHQPAGLWLLSSRIATAIWLSFFLLGLPLLTRFEPRPVLPAGIA